MPGTLFVVATPIGNLEDITVRALRVLRDVALIAAEDTRRTARLLDRHAITTPLTSLHEHNETRKSPFIVGRLAKGESVALVTDAGTPTVSDPGAHLVRLAVEAGIRVEPIPGPSAAIAALSVSGLSAERFAFLGFPPVRPRDRNEWFDRMASFDGAVIFFEAPHRIRATLEELRARMGDIPILVTRELTKVHEELVRGPISVVLGDLKSERGEYTVVVELGHITDRKPREAPSAARLATEFGELAKTNALSRRAAVAEIARRYGLKPNRVYAALEVARKSGV